ncbi:MAG: ABC transporter permease [Clostridia bacterium]|nr:ABC transporter permease [Clostridia bacterium]
MPVQLITTHTDTYEIEKPDVTPVGAIPYLLAKIRGEDPFDGAVDPETGDFTRVVFNLGKSLRESKGQYVTDIIQDKMGISLTVGLISLAFSLVLGVVFGVLQAQFKNGIIDHIGTGYTVLVNAVPHLVIYTLIMVLGSKLLQVPMQYDANAGADSWRSMILPVVCLSIGSIAGYMLWTRRYMVDELNKDYIRLARLKGLPEHKVLFRHVLKNAFVPLAQYLPYSILLTVGGSLLVERFFGIPGMGPMLTNSIAKLDLPLVQGIVMLYASLGIIGVFLGDLLMTLIDPRIKLTGKEGVR